MFVVIKIVLDMLDGPNKDGQRFRYSQEVRLRTVVKKKKKKKKKKMVLVVAKLALAFLSCMPTPFCCYVWLDMPHMYIQCILCT